MFVVRSLLFRKLKRLKLHYFALSGGGSSIGSTSHSAPVEYLFIPVLTDRGVFRGGALDHEQRPFFGLHLILDRKTGLILGEKIFILIFVLLKFSEVPAPLFKILRTTMRPHRSGAGTIYCLDDFENWLRFIEKIVLKCTVSCRCV